MRIVFIAAKYRGETPWEVEQNIRAAEAMALDVARLGAVPMCPHTMYRHFDKALPDLFWLDATKKLLEACDAILLGPNWRTSAGALEEKTHAKILGLPVFVGLLSLGAWLSLDSREDSMLDIPAGLPVQRKHKQSPITLSSLRSKRAKKPTS